MVRLPLNKLIEWVQGGPDEEWIVKSVNDSIRRLAGSRQKNKDDYLNQIERGLADHYKDAVNVTDGRIVNPTKWVECLRLAGVSLDIDLSTPPWERWVPGSEFIIVYGERRVPIPEVSTKMDQRVVGARDAKAIAYLVDSVRSELQINCRVDILPVPSYLSSDEANKKLDCLLERTKEGGAIVVVGSPIVNPLADCIAERITDRNPRGTNVDEQDLPGKFHWKRSRRGSYLSDPGAHRGKEGIRIGGLNLLCKREDDDQVFEELSNVPSGRKTFHDCGMLLMDCRQKDFLILCAGHGGCGTLGCVYALVNNREQIASRLVSGGDRLFAVIKVKRSKTQATPPEIDDLDTDPQEVQLI